MFEIPMWYGIACCRFFNFLPLDELKSSTQGVGRSILYKSQYTSLVCTNSAANGTLAIDTVQIRGTCSLANDTGLKNMLFPTKTRHIINIQY